MTAYPTTFAIDRNLVYATIYELSAKVFGSEAMALLSTGDDKDEFDRLRLRHEISQVSKLLIEIAVIMRNFMDSGSWPIDVIHETRVDGRPEITVGAVMEREIEKELSFRDACNKLIHAERISFGMKSLPGKMACLDGMVELHGRRREDHWIAKIRISDFARMAARQL